jgi:glycosyltransferase involved in cell wall biosynthesis
LLEDPQLRRAMGEQGRARAVAEFSVERVIEQTLGLYRELLAERSAAARNR